MRLSIGSPAIVLALAALLWPGGAEAQQFGGPVLPFNGFFPGRPAPGERSPLRVQVQYQVQVPSNRDASLDQQKATIEVGHAALYGLAKGECDALRKAFDGDCRVVGLTVGNVTPGFGPGGGLSMNATATIEISPPQPAPPAPAAKPQ